MKKLLVAIGVVFAVLAVLIIAVVVISSLGGDEQSQQSTVATKDKPVSGREARLRLWRDEYYPAKHVYNTRFFAGGSRGALTLKEVRFTGVERPFANLLVSLQAEGDPISGARPPWLKPKNFSLVIYQGVRERGRVASVKYVPGPSSSGLNNFNIRARGVLSKALSPTTPASTGLQAFLRVDGFYRGRNLTDLKVGITAPPPPQGLVFGEEKTLPAKNKNQKQKQKKAAKKKQKQKQKKAAKKKQKQQKGKKRGQN